MSADLVRGFRAPLGRFADPEQEFTLEMQTTGNAVYDSTCFGLDGSGKLSDERYMVFYNQRETPGGEISCTINGNSTVFRLNLSRLPAAVSRLVFTVSIDGEGSMGEISSHTLSIRQNQQEVAGVKLTGKDFQREKAIIALELYRKDVWRLAAVYSGFNGGLGDLLRSFGGEEAVSAPQPVSPPTPQPASPPSSPSTPSPEAQHVAPVRRKISLEKKLQQGAPHLVSLAKPIEKEIRKNHLEDCVARVALVLDISGSMTVRYRNGTVQEIVNRTLPLAVQFDDDESLDFWFYGSRCRKMPAVTMKNYQQAVPSDWKKLMMDLGGGNNEPDVMKEIISTYHRSSLPAYVLFVTDGGIYQTKKIQKLLIEASREPVFWQFVGVGGSDYGILKDLDTMKGRYVDNANFFALDDFRKVSNEELYRRLLAEFPLWLKEITQKGML